MEKEINDPEIQAAIRSALQCKEIFDAHKVLDSLEMKKWKHKKHKLLLLQDEGTNETNLVDFDALEFRLKQHHYYFVGTLMMKSEARRRKVGISSFFMYVFAKTE